jgi:hypothetical protein
MCAPMTSLGRPWWRPVGGLAFLLTVLKTSLGHDSAALDSCRRSWWFPAAISFVGLVPTFSLLRQSRAIHRHNLTISSET